MADVHNTPWGERYCYVLDHGHRAASGKLHYRTAKAFHVSPFMGMDLEYRWAISPPGRRFAIRIEAFRSEQKILDVAMSLSRREISGAALNGLLVRYPLMTLQVLSAIYAHAGLLWLKGAPFHPHPGNRAVLDHELNP